MSFSLRLDPELGSRKTEFSDLKLNDTTSRVSLGITSVYSRGKTLPL